MHTTASNVGTLWTGVKKTLFVVALEDKKCLFVESPAEQGLPDDGPQEGLIRVFTDRDAAIRYRDALEAYHGDKLVVMASDLQGIFTLLPDTDAHSWSEYECPVKLGLSDMEENEHPKYLDTLWSQVHYIN